MQRYMEEYNPIQIEKKWRQVWEKNKRWKVDICAAKKPFYNLMMFPYPSAEGLHIGNVYAFTASDIYGRYQRMQGADVFEPMGFDSFGIHSENFALKKGVHPSVLTEQNVNRFRNQFKQIGALFDWDYEVNTSAPQYYKWTQWLFVQLYKQGLAYRKSEDVDWCPSCKTVLAHEQVVAGKCERCGTVVIQKKLEQWFLKITAYAERLLKNLDVIDWTESVKTMQRNWIGRSEGAEIKFQVSIRQPADKFQVPVFTTRPDTLFGATYLVLVPDHDLLDSLSSHITNWDEVLRYRNETQKKTEVERMEIKKDKTGIELKGIKAVNPATKEEIPVWIADYVLRGYGTGAIMAVPAHDQRDFDFAKKFNLPIIQVVCPNYPEAVCPILDKAYDGQGSLVASGRFTGTSSEEAKEAITEFVGGKLKTQYRLRDWLISRQRYWGPPIPIIYCRMCWEKKNADDKELRQGIDYIIMDGKEYAIIPVPEKDLPVELPYVENFQPTGTAQSPLANVGEFYRVSCPVCGNEARRETDVSDTFLDSSWYFLRYPSSHDENEAFDKEITKKWLPVNMYIGGKEHSVLHLLYSRFVTMVLHDMKLIDFEEPFLTFRGHGLLIKDGAKMSKSLGNVVNPDEYFASYGVDVMRMFLMFLAPVEQGGDWRDSGISGIARFLKRVWTLCQADAMVGSPTKTSGQKFERLRHRTIQKVTRDVATLQYNTAISSLMEYANEISKGPVDTIFVDTLLTLLAPLAPHLSEELWQIRGHEGSVHDEPWPEYDEAMIQEDTVEIPVQVNGKIRGHISLPADYTHEQIQECVMQDEKLGAMLRQKKIIKWIIVPKKLVNILVEK